jgi:2-oxoglutarate/2-oxoacid ferredoxin oxidoreductase subunit alpha
MTGAHYLDGDYAAAEGCLAAGCRFVGGYPITPSTEVAERMTQRFPLVGGFFIQMEDELAAMNAIQGAAWAGKKTMTVTSGPGFSLMMENLGLAIMFETPCVLINVQRGGPSTGLPTMVGQADMMQAKWGSHGDYEIIALAPSSPQECFDYAIKCFNLSEKYRTPVLLMMDECVGHMTEKVVVPSAEEIEIEPRRYTTKKPGEYLPYEVGDDLVPDFAKAGDGYRYHITGLTHDERGYPVMTAECQDRTIKRLIDKIKKNSDDIIEIEEEQVKGADVVVVSYGISYRVAQPAVDRARAEGIKVGQIRLVTVWPFPEKRIAELAKKIKAYVVPEINLGQIVLEVERCAGGKARTIPVTHAGGWVHDVDDVHAAIKEAAK